MKKPTTFFFYLLGVYVVLQFSWWGFHLIQLTKELGTTDAVINKRIGMIIGEGMVFLLILFVGMWRIKRSIQKEHDLSKQQNNFLLSVTHELKTPLASTKLYLQTLLKRNFEAEKREELLHKALAENQRLEEIVESILISARIENRAFKIHKERFKVLEEIQKLADRYTQKLGFDWIRIEAEQDYLLETDLFMFQTILVNLLENALKYAGTNEKVIIKIQAHLEGVRIQLIDCGPGIPQEQQERIFQKFVRLENEETRSKKGTGLGLYIVKEFTRLCGGQIKYKANQPTGAIFELTL